MANEAGSIPLISPAIKWYQRTTKKLYDWVLHWAETPYAVPALAILAFAESSFFPIPPDVLLIALALSIPKRSFRYAAICAIFSVLGGLLGYLIGYALFETIGKSILEFYQAMEGFAKVRAYYDQWGPLMLAVATFTPIPYKVFTIASGVFEMPLIPFVAISAVGRSARFFMVATLIYFFGAPVKRFIDKYFDLLSVLFVILLVGGFVGVKWVL